MGPRRNYLCLVSVVGVVLLFVPGVDRTIAVALMLAPWPLLGLLRWLLPPAPREVVLIDEQGVTRAARGRPPESVTWAELVAVDIVTTSDGPFADDFFFVLHGSHDAGCAVANTLGAGLLSRLQRLPRFDNAQVILASGCTSEARFVCWTGVPGEALVAAAPAPAPPT